MPEVVEHSVPPLPHDLGLSTRYSVLDIPNRGMVTPDDGRRVAGAAAIVGVGFPALSQPDRGQVPRWH